MFTRYLKIALLLLFTGLPAHAEQTQELTIVELFTSQGCSSCPPADALLRSMQNNPNLMTLSWSVDYWDRMGWEDTFALPHNAMRQTAYNKRFGVSGVYTPQIIVDGSYTCVGSNREIVEKTIKEAVDNRGDYITPTIDKTGSNLVISLPEFDLDSEPLTIRVVFYQADATVNVSEGENVGRKLHYSNIVRQTDILGDWAGSKTSYVAQADEARQLGADHAVVLLQKGYRHGPIVGAARIKL